MKKSILYYGMLLVIVAVIIKVGYAVLELAEPTFFWTITIFMFVVSMIVFTILVVFGDKNPEHFVKLVLSSMVAKIITFIIFVGLVIYLDRENASSNIVLFLSLYVCYTVSEVALLLKKISTDN